VDRRKLVTAFQFQDDLIFDQNVQPIAAIYADALV
jgi:hypothetical protein